MRKITAGVTDSLPVKRDPNSPEWKLRRRSSGKTPGAFDRVKQTFARRHREAGIRQIDRGSKLLSVQSRTF